jgi:hypothetical protein
VLQRLLEASQAHFDLLLVHLHFVHQLCSLSCSLILSAN